jgi:activator of HSP90 ATPase
MPKTIQQSVTLPAPAERLFAMYLDAKIHQAFTGAPVTISSEPGSEFRAFDNMLAGRMLYTIPKRMIVQSWRAKHWQPEDVDSILILTFWPQGDAGRIELVQGQRSGSRLPGSQRGLGKLLLEAVAGVSTERMI